MKDITISNVVTITAIPQEIYHFSLLLAGSVTISNQTDGEILAGRENDFTENDGVTQCITLPSGYSLAGFRTGKDLYIKSIGSGKIVVGKD